MLDRSVIVKSFGFDISLSSLVCYAQRKNQLKLSVTDVSCSQEDSIIVISHMHMFIESTARSMQLN